MSISGKWYIAWRETKALGFESICYMNHNKVVISKALENYVTEIENSLCTDLTRQDLPALINCYIAACV